MADDNGASDEKPTTKDVAYYEAEAKKAYDIRNKVKAERDELKAELARVRQEAEDAAEHERAKKAGEFDQRVAQIQAKHATELAELKQKAEALDTQMKRTMVGRAFAEAVDLFGPTGKTIYLPGDAERIFGDRVTVIDGVPAVLDDQGQPMQDATGRPKPFAAAMADYIESLPDKVHRLRGSGKTGSGSSGGATSGGREPINLSNLSPAQMRDPKVLDALKASLGPPAVVMGDAYTR